MSDAEVIERLQALRRLAQAIKDRNNKPDQPKPDLKQVKE